MENHTERYNRYIVLLDQCDKEISDIYHEYALRYHLSDAALWIIYALADAKEGLTQADICSCWFLSRQTINTALKGLERQKLIKLLQIPGNRKSKQIVFTADGKALAENVIAPLKQAEYQVFAAFSDQENRLFTEMAQKRCALLREFLL